MSTHFLIDGQKFTAPPLAMGLYVVATPIGHLKDISIRALQTLAAVHVVACEDTRTSRKLLNHYGIQTHTISYHDHNGEQRRPEILARLAKGEAVALISDAGTPLISDPGYKLVRDVRAAGFDVFSIPGACAAIAGLTTSGLPTDSFTFLGFLPPKTGARKQKILPYLALPTTLILYESGNRVAALLRDLTPSCGTRLCVVARELTKMHETIYEGTVAGLAEQLQDETLKGEIVVLIAPAEGEETPASQTDVETLLKEHLKTLPLKIAVQLVAEQTHMKKSDVYAIGLKVKESSPPHPTPCG